MRKQVSTRLRTLLTGLAFSQSLCLLALPARAGNDDQALALAEKALYEDYLNLEFISARTKLQKAIKLCEKDCSPASTARVYRDMGVLLVAGLQKRDQGVDYFKKALKADPSIQLEADLSTPELESAFEEAQAAAGSGEAALGAAMRQSVDEDVEGAPPEEQDELLAAVEKEQEAEPEPEPEPAPPAPEPEPEPEPEPAGPATQLDLDTSDCPPDFPGCESFEDQWAAESEEEAARHFPRHWLSVGFQMDFLLLDATTTACTGDTYQCFYGGGVYRNPQPTTTVNNVQRTGVGDTGQGDISSGLVPATQRVLVGYDFAITPNFLIGVRGGFAFNGGPQKDTTPPGKEFMPIHAEARVGYWFTGVKSGTFRPYAQLGGGMAQIDGAVSTPIVDGERAGAEICATDPDCVIQPVDAWKKTGQGFVNIGLGTLIALGNAHGFLVEARAMQMLGSAGLGAGLQAGYAFGL